MSLSSLPLKRDVSLSLSPFLSVLPAVLTQKQRFLVQCSPRCIA